MLTRIIKVIRCNEILMHTSFYFTSNVMIKVLDFISLFIFARIMLPSEYGAVEIFRNLIALVTTVVGLKISAGIKRYYFEEDSNIGKALFTSLVIIFLTNLIIFLIYSILIQYGIGFKKGYTLLIIGFTNSIYDLYINYLQTVKNSRNYLFTTFVFRIILLIFTLLGAIIIPQKSFNGYVIGSLIAYSLVGVFSIYNILKISVYKMDIDIMKYLIAFSLPMVPATISGFILSYFDRIMIASIDNLTNSGIYSLAYNISLILSVLVMSLNQSWQPVFYGLRKENRIKDISKSIDLNSLIITYVGICIILFSKEVFMFFPKEYSRGEEIVGIITIGLFLTYIYSIYLYYATYHKKILLLSINSILTSILNIILNWIFIPRYGYEAAAYTTMVSYLFMVMIYYITVRKYLEKDCYPIYKFIIPLLSMIVITLQLQYISILPYWKNFIVRVFIIILVTFFAIRIFMNSRNKINNNNF